MPPRPTSSNLENRRPPLHLCDLSKTTTRSALTVDLAAQGSLRVASGWLRGAYRLATRWPEGGLRARPEGRSSRRLVAVRRCAASPPVNVTALVRPHRRVVGPHFPGFGVALVEPWCGFGGALVWLWGGCGVALGGLGVALGCLCTPESMPST